MKRRTLLLVLVVAAVVVVATVSVYVLTRPPPPISLTISDGSTAGTIVWNETTGSNQTDLVLDFTATTYANETGGAASTLTLRLHTWTFFNSGAGAVEVDINATVAGTFASDLHAANLQLLGNQTGPNGSLQSWADLQLGTNVSFDAGQSFGVLNGSGVLSATIVGGAYRFSYSDFFDVTGRPWYNRFVGFRATVTGPFTPAVSVGILLRVVDQPA